MSDDLFELGERIADLAARINIATFDMLTLVAEFDRREAHWRNGTAAVAIPGAQAGSPKRTMSSTGPMAARRVWPTRSCSAAATTTWSTRARRAWRWTVTARPRSSRGRGR